MHFFSLCELDIIVIRASRYTLRKHNILKANQF